MIIMDNEKRCKSEHLSGDFRGHNHRRRGPSSYTMHDPELVFRELKLKEREAFLDLGCGAGDYSIHASKIVGNSGVVYALDVWENLLNGLEEEAVSQSLKNIQTKLSDINSPLPIEDNCIDVCFIATVLHTLNLDRDAKKIFSEVRRVLKPEGRLSIIECKKEDMPFGPPKHMRNSPEEVEEAIRPHGFEKLGYVDLGYNYMIQFRIK